MLRTRSIIWIVCLAVSMLATVGYAADQRSISVTLLGDDGKSEAFIQTFQAVENMTGIKAQINVIPADQALNVVRTKIVTGNADDVFIHPWGAYELPVDHLEPLDGPWADKIGDATRPFCLNYKDPSKIIKAPFAGQTNFGLIYNKEILQKAGVTLPMKNFSELVAACEAIKALGITPLYLSNEEEWTAQVLFLSSQTGVFMKHPDIVEKLVSNQMKPVEIPALVKHWENGASLLAKGYINSDYMSTTHPMALQAIAEGKGAFYCTLDLFYGEMKNNYPDQIENIGMTNTPLWDDEQYAMVMTNPSARFLSVPSNGKNVDVAKEFVNAFLSEEGLKTYYQHQPGLSPFKDLGFELQANAWNKEMAEYAKTIPQYGDWANSLYDGKPALNGFWGDFNKQVQGLFAGKSVEDSLNAWYKKYVIDAKAKKLPGF